MSVLAKRLLIALVITVGFSAVVFALSQNVVYKPWGVPDSRRDEYDAMLAEIERKEQLKSIPTARVRSSVMQHDFEWVAAGKVCRHSFKVSNVGEVDLELDVLDKGRDDIRVTLDTNVVAPGQSAKCDLEWTVPESDSIDAANSVFLATNDPINPKVRFSCTAKRRQEIIAPKSIRFEKNDLGESATASFYVFTQLSDQFEVKSVSADGFELDWTTEPASPDEGELKNHSATSAVAMTVNLKSGDFGKFNGMLVVHAETGTGNHEHAIPFSGKVRPPIGFYGPELYQKTGLDMGTLDGGKRKDFYVTVRSRVDKAREIEVLEIVPDALETELTKADQDGSYRLRITVPEGCPDLQYNLDQNRGYVKVGDPKSDTYSSWLPIWVSVSNVKN
ncbi:hypothetical protein LOC67_00650 [Stieleria sp. JC731]|uniref:hypothetical protein n=1 Tax=Pirellulaceae TaxID=2691357 RepID=UPI001E31CA4B|nr:hypothetical protein [Stieleria sp. JC731]MCC9599050.1 hypothetical protein [Stieleria sp. JC731]